MLKPRWAIKNQFYENQEKLFREIIKMGLDFESRLAVPLFEPCNDILLGGFCNLGR